MDATAILSSKFLTMLGISFSLYPARILTITMNLRLFDVEIDEKIKPDLILRTTNTAETIPVAILAVASVLWINAPEIASRSIFLPRCAVNT
jgi:hypothetical protein